MIFVRVIVVVVMAVLVRVPMIVVVIMLVMVGMIVIVAMRVITFEMDIELYAFDAGFLLAREPNTSPPYTPNALLHISSSMVFLRL